MLDNKSSLRLDLLKFPLIVGVVFIHAYGTSVGIAGGQVGANQPDPISDFVTTLVSQGLARIAVPTFFLMSGYLFFLDFRFSADRYLEKVRTRIWTLLIPFLFWNVATLAIHALAQTIPFTRQFFSGRFALVETFGWFDYLNAVFGFDQRPIAYQFWFVRDLMLLVLLVPFISILQRFAAIPLLSLLFACWFVDVWPVYSPSAEASLFFCAGAWLSARGKSLFVLDRLGAYFVVAYIPLVALDMLSAGQSFHPHLHRAAILAGMFAVLWLTRFSVEEAGLSKRLQCMGSASFFVFAIHEPLLTILKKISYTLMFPSTPSHVLLLYFVIPFVTILVALFVHRILTGVAPKFTAVVTGGR